MHKSTDWNSKDKEKLWLYNLHYFDDLNALNASDRSLWHKDLVDCWISDNAPGDGNGWEPYPLSLRTVNWIKWALSGAPFSHKAQHSLAIQTRFLAARLEWNLLGNHLFANGKALLFAGLFFTGPEAARWRETGLNIVRRELNEQILADGGHFELSPMYHSIIFEDVLDLINLAQLFPDVIDKQTITGWKRTAGTMAVWLKSMCHPDGQISFFNDAAFGIAALPQQLMSYADSLEIAIPGAASGAASDITQTNQDYTHLRQSGYLRIARQDAVAILDLAAIGPDYLPGHAHADSLSFEMSLFGQRLFVNSGTSLYGTGPQRLAQRATAAHNTVEIDGQNSSEVWAGFRVARRARILATTIETEQNALCIHAAHDGYQRLPGHVCHSRQWQFGARTLEVVDTITGSFQTAIARYHLHPDVRACASGDGRSGVLTLPGGQKINWSTAAGQARICAGNWHREFGHAVPNQCLEIHMSSRNGATKISW